MGIGRKAFEIQGAIYLVVAMVGLAGCGSRDEPKIVTAADKAVRAKVLVVTSSSSFDTFEASGTVRANFNSTLSSKVMGHVDSIAVRDGDPIRKGQLLVSLDSRELVAAVNIANANLHSSAVSVANATTSAEMEERTSKARVIQAEAQVNQTIAALSVAEARRDLTVVGPRTQEVAQSHLAVVQAESGLRLARTEFERTKNLVLEGAMARRELDVAQNRLDVAKSQYDATVQGESIAREGSRSQEIRASQDSVAQARAAVAQAKSGVAQAKAAALQSLVRRKEIDAAKAQLEQSSAAVQSARVGLSYAQVLAPFDGRVVQRFVDPGSMASPGVPLLAVEGGEFRLEATVPERIMKFLAIGSVAPVSIDSNSAGGLRGRVVEIIPHADPTSHSFLVKFALPPTAGVRSGMFGRATIRTGVRNRILIPMVATWLRDGLHYVFEVSKEGVARIRIVTLGDPSDGKVEVFSGLGQGDRIVVGDRSTVSDGARVEAN